MRESSDCKREDMRAENKRHEQKQREEETAKARTRGEEKAATKCWKRKPFPRTINKKNMKKR